MDQKQLNAIKERVAKAAPGPWICDQHNDILTQREARLARIITRRDAEFITHARKDVPVLVSEVERLRKALEQVMEVEAPIMEGTKGWETRSYEIARKALEGEAHD